MTTATAADFLASRFRHNRPEDYIEVRPLDAQGKIADRFWHHDPAAVARRVATLPGTHAIYYGTNPHKKGKGTKADVTSVVGIIADVDFKHFGGDEAAALAAIMAFPLVPTWIIHSGGGYQCYWDCTTPITDPAQFPIVEALQARLYVALGGLDSVQDVSRIFRVPGSLNSKPEYGTPRPVTIVAHHPEALYTVEDFLALLPEPPAVERPAPPTFKMNPAAHVPYQPGDIPTIETMRDMLGHIPPEPGYHTWLSILGAVHSAYPGSDGEALCEEWSGHVSKPGEIAEKFRSFGKHPKPATIGTIVFHARQHGWQPPRATFTSGAALPESVSLAEVNTALAERDTLIAQLRADVQRLGDALRREQDEGARMVARIGELETEVRAWEASAQHPDQTVAGCAFDIAEAVTGPDWRGEELVQDGECYRLLPKEQSAKRRSPATLTRAVATCKAAGTLKVLTRTVQIETPRYKGPTEKTFIHIPGMEHKTPAAVVLNLLPPPTKKRHGGRKVIAVPQAVAQQEHPVKREREIVESFFSLVNGDLLGKPKVTTLAVDYWTSQGEQLTTEEAAHIQDESGTQPRPTPLRQAHIPRYVPPVPVQMQVERREPINLCVQVDDSPPGTCPDCGSPIVIGGYCAAHFGEHRDRSLRYVGDWGEVAAGGGDD